MPARNHTQTVGVEKTDDGGQYQEAISKGNRTDGEGRMGWDGMGWGMKVKRKWKKSMNDAAIQPPMPQVINAMAESVVARA